MSKPGRELPKEYRKIAGTLVNGQGWRYETGKGHVKLLPPDRTKPIVTVSTTPTSDSRAYKNFVSRVRQSGGKA